MARPFPSLELCKTIFVVIENLFLLLLPSSLNDHSDTTTITIITTRPCYRLSLYEYYMMAHKGYTIKGSILKDLIQLLKLHYLQTTICSNETTKLSKSPERSFFYLHRTIYKNLSNYRHPFRKITDDPPGATKRSQRSSKTSQCSHRDRQIKIESQSNAFLTLVNRKTRFNPS